MRRLRLGHLTPPPFALPGFARTKTLTLISSDSHVGKTALAAYASICAAERRDFLGFGRPVRPQLVTFLALDSADWDIDFQFTRAARALNILPSTLHRHLYVLHDHFVNLPPDDTSPPRLREIISHEGPLYPDGTPSTHLPNLLVVDCYSNTHLQDENDNLAMTLQMLKVWRPIAADGVAVVILHHHGKPSKERWGIHQARGASSLPQRIDAHLTLRLENKAPDHAVIEAYWAKGRALSLPAKWKYRMAWSDDTLAFERADGFDLAAWHKATILDRLQPGRHYTWQQLLAVASTSSQDLKPLKDGWLAEGRLIHTPGSGYSLPRDERP